VEDKEKEVNPFIKKEEERKSQIQAMGINIRFFKKKIQESEESQKYYIALQEGFKKIRIALFQTMIEQLESLVEEYMLRYSSELSIILSTERETRSDTIKEEFNISIVDSNGFKISYEMYSGGERQKVRLSIARALAQFNKDDCDRDFNFICFDEPNDSLDDMGKEVNFETFMELAEVEGKAVFVTDHDANFKSKFHHTILVTKENGASRISHV
jgi:ABC-type hemin transport system ATPase subunit